MLSCNQHQGQEVAISQGRRVHSWFAVGLVLVWVGFTAAGFWYLQWQYIRPFSSDTLTTTSQFFEGAALSEEVLAELENAPSGYAIHFWDPACPCSRFSTPHTRDLVEQADASGVSSLLVVRDPTTGDGDRNLKLAEKAFGDTVSIISWSRIAGSLNLPASPAALVINNQNELTYIGPYSSDAYCSPGRGAFVEDALKRLKSGQQEPVLINNLAQACFCGWDRNE